MLYYIKSHCAISYHIINIDVLICVYMHIDIAYCNMIYAYINVCIYIYMLYMYIQ